MRFWPSRWFQNHSPFGSNLVLFIPIGSQYFLSGVGGTIRTSSKILLIFWYFPFKQALLLYKLPFHNIHVKQILFMKTGRLLWKKKAPARNTAGMSTQIGSNKKFSNKGSDTTLNSYEWVEPLTQLAFLILCFVHLGNFFPKSENPQKYWNPIITIIPYSSLSGE